jgi:hypothetical protein
MSISENILPKADDISFRKTYDYEKSELNTYCEDGCLLGCCAMQSVRTLATFQSACGDRRDDGGIKRI